MFIKIISNYFSKRIHTTIFYQLHIRAFIASHLHQHFIFSDFLFFPTLVCVKMVGINSSAFGTYYQIDFQKDMSIYNSKAYSNTHFSVHWTTPSIIKKKSMLEEKCQLILIYISLITREADHFSNMYAAHFYFFL